MHDKARADVKNNRIRVSNSTHSLLTVEGHYPTQSKVQTVESVLALVQFFKGTVCVIIALLLQSKLANLTVLSPISLGGALQG